MERGAVVHCGPTAVLDVDGIAVVVTSAVAAANDPAFVLVQHVDTQ